MSSIIHYFMLLFHYWCFDSLMVVSSGRIRTLGLTFEPAAALLRYGRSLMSWIKDGDLNILQKLAINIIKRGNIPRHVAFIMDGNRRFAKKSKVDKVEGHRKGFDMLTEVLRWCLDLGVIEVTVYAFSLENFKRSEEEVNELMDLARQKFKKLLEEKVKLMNEGVNIRIIGDLSRVPEDVFQLMSKAVCITKENKKLRLTVAFSYTGQNEIAESIRCISKGLADGKLHQDDITTGLIEKSLYSEDSEVPDLLIRTSGEVRLSDFMLWQSSCSCVYFTPVLWPEFSLWELLKAVFHYQRNYDMLRKLRSKECTLVRNERVEKFLSELYEYRYEQMKAAAS